MIYGYARVSTDEQDHQLQLDALNGAGCDEIAVETQSGAKARPKLDALLKRLQPGDHLICWKLDRLGRSTIDVLDIIKRIEQAGATFACLTQQLENRTPGGKLMTTMLAGMAEFERDTLIERTKAGLAAARARGRVGGRPPKLSFEQAQQAADRLKHLRWRDVADIYDVTEEGLRRALKRYDIAVPADPQKLARRARQRWRKVRAASEGSEQAA